MPHGRTVRKAASPGPVNAAGHLVASGDIAAERPTSETFIVRIYRVDTQDGQKIAGLVEALDGSGEKEPFTRIDELGAILKRRVMDGKAELSVTEPRR